MLHLLRLWETRKQRPLICRNIYLPYGHPVVKTGRTKVRKHVLGLRAPANARDNIDSSLRGIPWQLTFVHDIKERPMIRHYKKSCWSCWRGYCGSRCGRVWYLPLEPVKVTAKSSPPATSSTAPWATASSLNPINVPSREGASAGCNAYQVVRNFAGMIIITKAWGSLQHRDFSTSIPFYSCYPIENSYLFSKANFEMVRGTTTARKY